MFKTIIEKLKDFWTDLQWEWHGLTGRQKALVGIAYGLFLLLFFFIGIPKASLLSYVIGFVLLTAFFVGVAYFVWVKILDK